MKRLAVLSALFSALAVAAPAENQAQGADITQPFKDNLASMHPLACVPLTQVKNTDTPADIFKGLSECIKQNNYDDAADLFAIAGAYGQFDAQRVTDKTAGQAKTVLVMEAFTDVLEDKKAQFAKVQALRMTDPKTLNTICANIKQIGHPNYFPDYMILHGMRAFTGENPYQNALEKNFDEAKVWGEVLAGYLTCPSQP